MRRRDCLKRLAATALGRNLLFLSGSMILCSPLLGADTLREAAHNRLLVGCAVATVDLGNPELVALVTKQFNCITPEYDLMPAHLVDDRGQSRLTMATASWRSPRHITCRC
jgi:hypothetical protein